MNSELESVEQMIRGFGLIWARPILKLRRTLYKNLIYLIFINNQIHKWAIFGKQNWRWGMLLKFDEGAKHWLIRYHKGCHFIETAGRWSWKSKSAKECVTTRLPNELALKMDGAQINDRDQTLDVNRSRCREAWARCRRICVSKFGVMLSVDLGVSSN